MKRSVLFMVGLFVYILSSWSFCSAIDDTPTTNTVLTPELRVKYNEWKTKRYRFDPKELEITKYSPKTIELAKNVTKYWAENESDLTNVGFAILKANGMANDDFDMDRPKIDDLPASVRKHRRFLDLLGELTRQSDYEIDAIGENIAIGEDSESCIPIVSLMNFACLIGEYQAKRDLDQGNIESALYISETLLRSAKIAKYPWIMERGVSIYNIDRGSNLEYSAISKCTDSKRVWNPDRERAYDKIRSDMFYDIPISVINCVAMLRSQQTDATVKIDGLTGYEIAKELIEKKRNVLFYPNPGLCTVNTEKFLKNTPYYFTLLTDGEKEFQNIINRSICQLDLLKLQSALRYVELTNPKRNITKVEDFVPDLIPVAPKDPYRTDGGTYSFKNGIFYSFSPDGKDDNATLFDEAKESGDIVLEAVK
jgi:hypothetical protein